MEIAGIFIVPAIFIAAVIFKKDKKMIQ